MGIYRAEPMEIREQMNILTKWLIVPASNATRQIEVAQLWEVRWQSRDGNFSTDVSPEVEAFPSKTEAYAFAESLKCALALLRHKGDGTRVTVERSTRVKSS